MRDHVPVDLVLVLAHSTPSLPMWSHHGHSTVFSIRYQSEVTGGRDMCFKLDQYDSVQSRDMLIGFPGLELAKAWDERTDMAIAAMRWQVKCQGDHLTNDGDPHAMTMCAAVSRRGAIGSRIAFSVERMLDDDD
jgi:hypothetical protein